MAKLTHDTVLVWGTTFPTVGGMGAWVAWMQCFFICVLFGTGDLAPATTFNRRARRPPVGGVFRVGVPLLPPPGGGGGARGGVFSLIAALQRGVRGSGPGGGWVPGSRC